MTLSSTYADLEIRILEQQAEGYPVEITLNHEQEFEAGFLDPAFLPWVPGPSPAEDGERLFAWLQASDPFKTAWAEIRGQYPQRRVRLRLDADVLELHAIPWELLRDAGGTTPQDLAATTATPFSRYLAGQWRPGSPILKRPIKILVAIANPENLSEFNLAEVEPEKEWALLAEAIGGLAEVTLTRLEGPCTLSALEEALREGHHLLHLVAHGQYSQRRDQTVLYVADEDNRVKLVNGEELAAMLTRQLADVDIQREDKLRLVFLASCQTATNSPADAFRAVAPALVAAGVPAVLAMQDLVPVETARAFSQTFYRQLIAHGQVDLASNEARSALMTAGLPGAAIPVLFMRLRSGALLGKRGRITSNRAELFWPFLLENIDRGQCTPILGPRVNEGLLPGPENVAERLADRYGYPLPDRRDLARVAQFMALNDPAGLQDTYLGLMQRSLYKYLGLPFPSSHGGTEERAASRTEGSRRRRRTAEPVNFTETVETIKWAEMVLTQQENELHHLLADIEFPLYLTTNFDNFMVEALKYKGLNPRREGLRWNPQAGVPHYVLSPPPSLDNPVVFHLNGHDGDPTQKQHLILSEDDYLAHFARIYHEQDTVLPMNVLEMLSAHSFLFLGYNLDDWEFRVVLQGLLNQIAQTYDTQKPHVGVQLEVYQAADADKARAYLQRYLGRFNIDIYWGTPQQFVTELHAQWLDYIAGAEDDEL
jgi:hypothetical protein